MVLFGINISLELKKKKSLSKGYLILVEGELVKNLCSAGSILIFFLHYFNHKLCLMCNL